MSSTLGGGCVVRDQFNGSQRLQEGQDYCLICDDELVKCEAMEGGDAQCLEERGQSCRPASSFGGACDGFGGVELMASKFCELFGITGPVERWVATKILEEEEEKSLFCEGCDAQVKMLIELKRRVEQLEEKLEGGKNEIRGLVKMAEGRKEEDGLRRNSEIRSIRQQILREQDGSSLPIRSLSKRFSTREAVVVISQDERKLADTRLAVNAAKVDERVETPMDESDFQCFSDFDDSVSTSPPSRLGRLGRCRASKKKVRVLGKDLKKSRDSSSTTSQRGETKQSLSNPTDETILPVVVSRNLADDDDDGADEDCNSDTKKIERQHYYKLKDGVCTYKGTTLRLCDDDNGEVPLFKCDTCGDIVPRKKLRHHVLSKHIIEECKWCGKVCNLYALRCHIQSTHRQKKTATCPICGKPDMNYVLLKRHAWSHLNSEERLEFLAKKGDRAPVYAKVWSRSVCELCGVTLSGGNLTKHMRTVHGTLEDRKAAMRICPICGRAVTNLNGHIKRNHSGEQYPCPHCENKVFYSKHGFRRHIRSAHRSKSFHCTICDRAFMRQNVLEAHMNCHLGIRPFKCDHCEMTFTTQNNLYKHCKRYHTEGRQPPRRKSYVRGPDRRKKVAEG